MLESQQLLAAVVIGLTSYQSSILVTNRPVLLRHIPTPTKITTYLSPDYPMNNCHHQQWQIILIPQVLIS